MELHLPNQFAEFHVFLQFFFQSWNKTWYSFAVPWQENTAYARGCYGWTNWARAV